MTNLTSYSLIDQKHRNKIRPVAHAVKLNPEFKSNFNCRILFEKIDEGNQQYVMEYFRKDLDLELWNIWSNND